MSSPRQPAAAAEGMRGEGRKGEGSHRPDLGVGALPPTFGLRLSHRPPHDAARSARGGERRRRPPASAAACSHRRRPPPRCFWIRDGRAASRIWKVGAPPLTSVLLRHRPPSSIVRPAPPATTGLPLPPFGRIWEGGEASHAGGAPSPPRHRGSHRPHALPSPVPAAPAAERP